MESQTDLLSLLEGLPRAPARHSIAVSEPINNDVVVLKFSVDGGREQEAQGRVSQMLAALVSRGAAGLTSAEFHAGVRVSDSIHKLRRRHGLGIETERVGHSGAYSGEHAIYRLSSSVRVHELVRAAELRVRKAAAKAVRMASGREARNAA